MLYGWEIQSLYCYQSEGIFSKYFGLLGPYGLPGKTSESIVPVDVWPMKFQGRPAWYWYANFSSLFSGAWNSEVSKRGRSECGRTQKHAKEHKRAQKSTNAGPQKSAKRAPKTGKERFRIEFTNNQIQNNHGLGSPR